LVENNRQIPLDVVIAAEDDLTIPDAQRIVTTLRRRGLSADLVATGSPRKRFDKASKITAYVLLSLRMQDGRMFIRHHSADWYEVVDRVKAILAELGYSE